MLMEFGRDHLPFALDELFELRLQKRPAEAIECLAENIRIGRHPKAISCVVPRCFAEINFSAVALEEVADFIFARPGVFGKKMLDKMRKTFVSDRVLFCTAVNQK